MDDRQRSLLMQAISQRHSVRRYHEKALPPEIVETLQSKIAEINADGALHVQLVLNEPKAFKGIFAYGKFSGVTNYLVIAGKKSPQLNERAGYCGEELVLLAQTLGLNSCWAGLSYTKVADTYSLLDRETIVCYIALGYGLTPGSARHSKTVADVSNASEATPRWFIEGVEAALKAPTAINQQKFRFEYVDEAHVRALRGFSLVGYTRIDLGIAKLHFEIAANHKFSWI